MQNYIRTNNSLGILSASTIKIIACIAMLIDHIGLMIFPQYEILRIIGRLAFPLFAYFIAEGCYYTKNRIKRFALLFIFGIVLLLFYYFFADQIYGNIFLTFSISTLLIFYSYKIKEKLFLNTTVLRSILALILFIIPIILLYFLYQKVHFEYKFSGMILPVIISLFDLTKFNAPKKIQFLDCHAFRILLLALGLIYLSIDSRMGNIQIYSFFAIFILLLYNGKIGIKGSKYGFYLFYPLHLLILEIISMLI